LLLPSGAINMPTSFPVPLLLLLLLTVPSTLSDVAEEQKELFDSEGIQRGSFLSGQWVSYPQSGANTRCATSQTEKDALVSIYDSLGGAAWTTSWDTNKCPCLHQWYGVVCDAQGHIVSLDLSQNGLVGPIPAAFQDLTWLNSIKLYANKLTGCIPTFFAGNTNLQTLYLQNNKLIGSIPHSVATVSETKDGSVLCGCKSTVVFGGGGKRTETTGI
jgi:hypothetical protein